MGCTETAARSWNVTPWWAFPRIDNFGTLDPQPGTGWKPDSNIQLPGHYPIVALKSGTVTSLRQTSFGQNVATVKLDQPINALATHTFYEHMSGFAPGLSVGQHVSTGDPIGFNNACGQVPLGFGLYHGDVYGSGPGYAILQNDLKPGGAGLLNPVALLDSAKRSAAARTPTAGVDATTGQGVQGSTTNTGGPCQGLDFGCWATWIGEHIAIFVIAIILIIVGLFLLAEKQTMDVAKTVGKALPFA